MCIRDRRGAEGEGPVYEGGGLRVDLARRQVFRAGEEVHLTPNEYKLLATLVQHAGKVLTHRQLLKAVWGPTYLTEVHYVRLYMGQLRHKLEADPARPRYLRIAVNLEMADPEFVPLVVGRRPQLRDAVIMTLSDKTPAMLSTPDGKKRLREEIFRRASEQLPEGALLNVYFSDLVVQ